MAKRRRIPYCPNHPGSFEREWLRHRGVSEWWYATGYLFDAEGKLFSFQFTLICARVSLLRPNVLMLALTDIASGKHYYQQQAVLTAKGVEIEEKRLRFGKSAELTKLERGMRIVGAADDFAYDLFLDYGKGAFWHCDHGKLRMGIPDRRATTLYYSYTNMPTTGTITMGGVSRAVTGKAWFDKQGGTYPITKPACMWEWFSLRFFDDEEIMLFSFPQSSYADGTYVRADGEHERLNRYTITPLAFTQARGYRFSSEWALELPGVKQERYRVMPIAGGQLNLAYFELLADIVNEAGQKVGYCFVELLPGVYNKNIRGDLIVRKHKS